jgi:hypothetical protein
MGKVDVSYCTVGIYFLNLYSNFISNFYCHILIFFHSDFKVGEFPGIPPSAPYILDMTLGRIFIKSSGDVGPCG